MTQFKDRGSDPLRLISRRRKQSVLDGLARPPPLFLLSVFFPRHVYIQSLLLLILLRHSIVCVFLIFFFFFSRLSFFLVNLRSLALTRHQVPIRLASCSDSQRPVVLSLARLILGYCLELHLWTVISGLTPSTPEQRNPRRSPASI